MSTTPIVGGYGCVNTSDSFTAKSIRFFTHSPYNHAFYIINSAGDILEAEARGSSIGNLSRFRGRDVIYSDDAVPTPPTMAEIKAHWTGIPYGFADIVALGLHLAFNQHIPLLAAYVHSQRNMICSQLVAEIGAAYGQADWICGQPDAEDVTPGMLAVRIE